MLRYLKPILYPSYRSLSTKDRDRFTGKWVVVTGASRGIGASLVEELIASKANLLLIARSESELKELCHRAASNGCVAIYRTIDMRNAEQLTALCEELPTLLPSVHFFFSNAGKSIYRTISDSLSRAHDFERTISLNYTAVVKLTLALLPALKRCKGSIISTSAVSLLYPFAPGWSAYHSSKGAADIWLQTAKSELSPESVRVKIAYMPLVHTEMSAPNLYYRNLPGYQPEEAARILLKLSIGKQSRYIPWWARVTAPIARFFAPLVTSFYRSFYKNKRCPNTDTL
ncbi:MAG: SDR family NAD(P)-dependent oxidoreductase [Porphyromonas sp.]|nr:SDR family NAD(P)-dependent oxidoreductase [Porphyromonas sp.]